MTDAASWYQGHRHHIGTVTPSGNTVVERITLGVALRAWNDKAVR